MDAATDGNYRLNVGLQYPNQPDYTDAGKETYNIKDPAQGAASICRPRATRASRWCC